MGARPRSAGVDEASPAMKEAAEIDKEEAAERDEQKARMPEVAKGLELPDRMESLRWTRFRVRRSWWSCCPTS